MLLASDVIKLFDGQKPDNIVASIDPVCWDPNACGNLPTSRLISPQDFRDMTSVTGSVLIHAPVSGAELANCISHARKLQTANQFTGSFKICVPTKQGRQELRGCALIACYPRGHQVLDVLSRNVVQMPKALQVFDGTWHKRHPVCASMFHSSHLAMAYNAHVAGVPACALIDSGATDCFIAESFVRAHNVKVKPHNDSTLTLGDGTSSSIIGVAKLGVALQTYHAQINFFVTNLVNGTDIVLGDSWLKKTKAVLDYERNMVKLVKGSKKITLTHVSPASTATSSDTRPAVLTAMKRAVKNSCGLFLVQVNRLDDELEEDLSWTKEDTAKEPPSVLQKLLTEYADVFPEDLPNRLPPDRGVGHTIPLEPGQKPPFRPLYRLSPLEHQEVQTQIKMLLEKGWIEPSVSPFGSPILFVQKKDGSLRMCVDYRAVNKQTEKNRYALPRIDDLLDQLHGSTVFTSLDLAQGYHQIRITPEDVPKTAFRTPIGHFQYRVLPFGLTNAPATFQAVMNDIFRPYLGKFVLIYLDDILIYSKTPEEHVEHLRTVLRVLRKHQFYAKKKKCTFMEKELLYLGHIISADGIRPDPAKVAAVQEWKVPTDLHQLRSFLGFGNFFRKFIQGYSKMVTPLTRLTRSSVKWSWAAECQEAFEGVKYALTHAPTLALADPTLPYELVADASGECLGAILLQKGRPIAFESRRMTPAERNYFTTEQECLAVIHALQMWRCYVEGNVGLTVVTDHKPNTYLATQPRLSRRQARWSEFLQPYRFEWSYRPGRMNSADPLSRHRREVLVLTRAQASATEKQRVTDVGAHISVHTPIENGHPQKDRQAPSVQAGSPLSAESASLLNLDEPQASASAGLRT